MKIDSFLASLEKDQKTLMVISLILYPLSFADCWKLSETFKHIDLPQQILLSAAVDISFLISGLTFIYIIRGIHSYMKVDIEIYPIVIIPSMISILTISGVVRSVLIFVLLSSLLGGSILLVQIIQSWRLRKEIKRHYSGKESDEKCE